ncbi:MAG: hypothetical protein WAO52_16370 [Prolixibacteraceae bacterium]
MKLPRYYYGILLIIPLFYISLSSYFHENIGLYSLRTADPEYIYYICGVEIANGHMKVGNIDHPGTTLQYFLAATFRVTYWIRGNNIPFNEDILSHADLYLKVANSAISFVIVLMMYLLGYLTILIVPNIWYGLIIQFSPFVSEIVYSDMGRITPEAIMPVLLMLLSVYVLSLLFNKYQAGTRNSILVFATLIAITLALKLTLVFIILIPLFLIPDWKKKLYFLFATFFIFLLFAIPVTLQLDYFWRWIKGLFFFSGQYGSGEKNIVKVNEFIPNIVNLIKLNHLYFKYTFFFLASFVLTFIFRKKSTNSMLNKLSLAISIVVFIQVLALGKHFKTTYFIPALMLLPLMIILTSEYLKVWIPERFSRIIPAVLTISVVFFFLTGQRNSIIQLSQHFEKENTEKMKAYYYLKSVEENSIKILSIGFYGAPSEEYALRTSYEWSGKDKAFFHPTLKKLYPDTYFYYPWDKTINYWGEDLNIKDTDRPVYIYLENNNLKDTFLADTQAYFPQNYELQQTFFNEATNEAVYKLIKSSE